MIRLTQTYLREDSLMSETIMVSQSFFHVPERGRDWNCLLTADSLLLLHDV
jgi:hypothetical protein